MPDLFSSPFDKKTRFWMVFIAILSFVVGWGFGKSGNGRYQLQVPIVLDTRTGLIKTVGDLIQEKKNRDAKEFESLPKDPKTGLPYGWEFEDPKDAERFRPPAKDGQGFDPSKPYEIVPDPKNPNSN